MTADPRAALTSLVAALERHLEVASSRRDPDDPAVVSAAEELTASPWSGRGRYRTGITGWYLKRNRSIGVSTDGGYYVLIVAPERFGRWRGVSLPPTPPPLQVGKGGRDGDSVALDLLLDLRLAWEDDAT